MKTKIIKNIEYQKKKKFNNDHFFKHKYRKFMPSDYLFYTKGHYMRGSTSSPYKRLEKHLKLLSQKKSSKKDRQLIDPVLNFSDYFQNIKKIYSKKLFFLNRKVGTFFGNYIFQPYYIYINKAYFLYWLYLSYYQYYLKKWTKIKKSKLLFNNNLLFYHNSFFDNKKKILSIAYSFFNQVESEAFNWRLIFALKNNNEYSIYKYFQFYIKSEFDVYNSLLYYKHSNLKTTFFFFDRKIYWYIFTKISK